MNNQVATLLESFGFDNVSGLGSTYYANKEGISYRIDLYIHMKTLRIQNLATEEVQVYNATSRSWIYA